MFYLLTFLLFSLTILVTTSSVHFIGSLIIANRTCSKETLGSVNQEPLCQIR